MICNSFRLSLLAVGLVFFNAWAEPGVAAPPDFFGRDNSTTFMTAFPNTQAKFNRFTNSLNLFGVDNIGLNPRGASAVCSRFSDRRAGAAGARCRCSGPGEFDVHL